MQGALRLAWSKRSRTRLAPTPTNISTNSEPEMEKNGTPASPAKAQEVEQQPDPVTELTWLLHGDGREGIRRRIDAAILEHVEDRGGALLARVVLDGVAADVLGDRERVTGLLDLLDLPRLRVGDDL